MKIILKFKKKPIAPVGVVMMLAFSLSACGNNNTVADAEVSPSTRPVTVTAVPSGSAEAQKEGEDAKESDEAVSRLVVSHETGMEVFNVSPTGLILVASMDLETQPRMVVAPDDRHVLLVESDLNRTQILDAGTYSQGHGDHVHHHLREPALRMDGIEGNKPTHAVNHDGRTAIFNDGDGTVDLFDIADITADGLSVETLSATSAHHGVAVPLREGDTTMSTTTRNGLTHGVEKR